jgi:hypothetical protein
MVRQRKQSCCVLPRNEVVQASKPAQLYQLGI